MFCGMGPREISYLLTKTTITGNASHSNVEIFFHNKAVNWMDKFKISMVPPAYIKVALKAGQWFSIGFLCH